MGTDGHGISGTSLWDALEYGETFSASPGSRVNFSRNNSRRKKGPINRQNVDGIFDG